MPPEEKSSLERMQERLYAPNPNPGAIYEPPLQAPAQPSVVANAAAPMPPAPAAPQRWQAPPPPPPPKPKKKISVAIWFFIGALVFAVIAAGVSAFFLLAGGRDVSNDKLDITISGQTTIASGSAVPITITIKNRNPAAITNTSLEADFPDGTRSADDLTQPLVRYTDTLGTITSGAVSTRTVQAVFFGSTNQSITVPVTLQYHTANSNAVFTKTQNYTFTITSSPLTITAISPSSVASGQPFKITVTVRSNATTPLTGIAVSAQYPAGFLLQKSANATSTGSLITIGTIQPGEEKDISISGALTGSDNDQRNFGFTVGTAKSDGSPALDVAYADAQSQITVTKPFLSASLSLNNATNDPLVVSPGQSVGGDLSWVNTLTSGITNGQVSVHISGNAYNPSGIIATNGYYDSTHAQVVFNKDGNPGLAHLNAGDTGSGSFTIGLKSGTALTSLRQPTIQLSVGVSGTPDGSNAAESIVSSFTRTIQIATDLTLSSKILHASGPFTNNGVLPPVQNRPTVYTVQLAVTNDMNPVGGATAAMILPSYVTYTGTVSPTDGSITYDETTRTVTWKVGSVLAGTTRPLTAYFQISYLPSSSQVGTSPILVQNQTLTGVDRFTGTNVGNTIGALTTQSIADPGAKPSYGIVAN